MIGGGGSTAKRAAADVIGVGAGRAGAGGATGRCGAADWNGRAGGADIERIGAGAAVGRPATKLIVPAPAAGASPPRKSPTRVSTNWLIEIPLASQNDFSR